MFTGIIEEIGEIIKINDAGEFLTIHIGAQKIMEDLRLGSSIAVNGVCLTVRFVTDNEFSAELSRETRDRTSLQRLRRGAIVNLERPMRGDSRFGGHIVQGHVDGIGLIRRFDRHGDSWDLQIEYREAESRYIVEKGSIAVDGISLTVASATETNVFSVAIIPYTFENTNLKVSKPNDPVNLEFDVLAKYVEKMIGAYAVRNH